MIVRIRLSKGRRVKRERRPERPAALAAAGLLTPSAVVASAFAFWRMAADLSWASRFAISSGLFSHWQPWAGSAVLLQLCSHLLNRYGSGRGAATS